MTVVRRGVRILPEVYHQRLERFAESALEGFAVIRRPTVMAKATLLSLASWFFSALVIYAVMRGFDLDIPATAALFVLCATSLGAIVPSSPGYVGVFHAIAIESLVNVFGVERSDAASFAFVLHAMLYLTPIALAGIYVAFERGTLRDVRSWASARDELLAASDAKQEAER